MTMSYSTELVTPPFIPTVAHHPHTIGAGVCGLLGVAGSAAGALYVSYPEHCIGTAVMAVGGLGARFKGDMGMVGDLAQPRGRRIFKK